MMTDKDLLISLDQDLSQVAGTYRGTGIDLGTTSPAQLGDGKPVEIAIVVTETFVSGTTNSTLNIEMVEDSQADLNSGSAVLLLETGLIAEAALVKGKVFRLVVPIERLSKRYLGLRYVIGTATTTAGKISAGVVADTPAGNLAGFTAESGYSA